LNEFLKFDVKRLPELLNKLKPTKVMVRLSINPKMVFLQKTSIKEKKTVLNYHFLPILQATLKYWIVSALLQFRPEQYKSLI